MIRKIVKRTFDIFCCSIALIILSPVFIVAAIGVKVSSPGPVFYRAQRAGKNKRVFTMIKFRSMHVASSAEKSFIADENRLFRWGAFMRKSKFDELPQLLNIIKGDMSIVGPRPASIANVFELYYGKYKEILSVKPGLTSIASLFDYKHGELFIEDNEQYIREILPVKLELELLNVKQQSLKMDFILVFDTVITILKIIFGKKDFRYTKYELLAMQSV